MVGPGHGEMAGGRVVVLELGLLWWCSWAFGGLKMGCIASLLAFFQSPFTVSLML